MKNFRSYFLKLLVSIYLFLRVLRDQFQFHGLRWLKGVWCFYKDKRNYLSEKPSNPNFSFTKYPLPYLTEKTPITLVEPHYFYQDAWACRKIFEQKPERHYDVGSSVKSISILSQAVPVTMVDIRPIEYKLEGLDFKKGSILALPFEDHSIKSLSSLCVVEHIGLGRYGDPIDPWGSEKAAKELQRVLAIDGNLYVSVPVDSQCQIFFNAHRAFTRDYVLSLFDELVLRDEIYVYVDKLYTSYDASKRFGTGIYWFSRVSLTH